MRANALNSHIDPVKTEMTGTQQIPISQICSIDKIESKDILADEILSQVYSTDEGKSESVIFDESTTEESKSRSKIEYDLSDDSKYRKSKIRKRHKKKNLLKSTKHDTLESLSSDSDISYKSDYKRKRRDKKKLHREMTLSKYSQS